MVLSIASCEKHWADCLTSDSIKPMSVYGKILSAMHNSSIVNISLKSAQCAQRVSKSQLNQQMSKPDNISTNTNAFL